MKPESERALRAVATQFGATREDLERIASSLATSPVPLLRDFANEAMSLLTGRTRETYAHHISRLVVEFGDRPLDQITPLDLERVSVQARLCAVTHRAARHGYGAQESFVSATRFLFASAVKAGHLPENRAMGLARPRRRRSPRRALSAEELGMVLDAVIATSRDQELDVLIFAFARETACRREGILHLKVEDIHPAPSVVLYEKYQEQREIPVSERLARALRAHAEHRHPGCPRVFHFANGRCLTHRRFDTMFHRVGEHLPWAKTLGVSLHWIRYSTLTDIRMTSGERVAAAYAGHGDQAGGVTALYTRATFAELQEAHRRLFGDS